jgi:hypothetical protein
MTVTNCDLFTHNESRSYLNHLVSYTRQFAVQEGKEKVLYARRCRTNCCSDFLSLGIDSAVSKTKKKCSVTFCSSNVSHSDI